MGTTKEDGAVFVFVQVGAINEFIGVQDNTEDNFQNPKWSRLEDFGRNFSSVFGPLWLSSAGAGEATEGQKTKAEIFQRFYVGQGRNFSRQTKSQLIDFYSDLFMKSPARQSLKLHSR